MIGWLRCFPLIIVAVYILLTGIWIIVGSEWHGSQALNLFSMNGVWQNTAYIVLIAVVLYCITRIIVRRVELLQRNTANELDKLILNINELSAAEQQLRRQYERVIADKEQIRNDEEKIRHQNEYYEALHDTALRLVKRQNVDELLRIIIERAALLMGTEHGYIFMTEPQDDYIVCRVGLGFYSNMRGYRLEPNAGLIGKVWQENSIIAVDDYRSWEGRLRDPQVDTSNFRALVGVPVVQGDKVAAVLGLLYMDSEAVFDQIKISSLEKFAQLAAVALENAILHDTARRELSERIKSEKMASHLAYHDPLTGLPNRNYLQERLRAALDEDDANDRLLAVLMLDLDGFKLVNDTAGHDVGDLLLREVAFRLSEIVSEHGVIANMGADKFLILVNYLRDKQQVAQLAEKVLTACRKVWYVNEHEFFLTASIGVSLHPQDGNDAQSLIKYADIAMCKAKERGKNNYQFYVSQLSAKANERLQLEKGLRSALRNEEFVLYYQPRYDINTGKIRSLEALIRWQNPVDGLTPPMKFIPLAEEIGLIIPLGEWIFRTVCKQMRDWGKMGIKTRVSVNLSGRQFHQSDLLEMIIGILQDAEVDPSCLEIEVTESTAMLDIEFSSWVLRQLTKAGVYIAMDDFGTGYSSLINLKRLPFNVMKIDKSFVNNIAVDPEDASMVEMIILMAHSMGLTVTAEGVETEEQLEVLRKYNCDELQGFLFSQPLPKEEVQKMLLEQAEQ